MKKKPCLSRFERLWRHAKSGHLLALIPCAVTEDILQACDALAGGELAGWIGFGSSERGEEEFLVLTAPKKNPTAFQTHVRQAVHDLGAVALVVEGFELCLLTPIFRHDEPIAALRQPVGISPRIGGTSDEMRLSFDCPEQRPEPEPVEWLKQLQCAYAELRGLASFVFEGSYE
jgi:hypothetical protein